MPDLLNDLGSIYGGDGYAGLVRVLRIDFARQAAQLKCNGKTSHIITSPPYVNAQDYFRNFKLELHVLEGAIPFSVSAVSNEFIGGERGNLMARVTREDQILNKQLFPRIGTLRDSRLTTILHRYLSDMRAAFHAMSQCLAEDGVLVIVCGDNLIGGQHIPTWRILSKMLAFQGFELFDRFSDQICCRVVPPQRQGHKGLIKYEVVSAFRRKVKHAGWAGPHKPDNKTADLRWTGNTL